LEFVFRGFAACGSSIRGVDKAFSYKHRDKVRLSRGYKPERAFASPRYL